MESHSKWSMAAVMLVVGLLVGGLGGWAFADMNKENHDMDKTMQSVSEKSPNPATKSADLRVTLNNLLREHVSSSLDVTRTIASGADESEIDGALTAQTANAVAVAGAIGSIYGEDAQKQITPMFVEHIGASNDYARAVEAGDNTAKDKAQTELNEYLKEISDFFASAIPSLDAKTVNQLLSEHEKLLNQSVEAYDSGDFEKSYAIEREALTQVSGISDALAGGIVKASPDKF